MKTIIYFAIVLFFTFGSISAEEPETRLSAQRSDQENTVQISIDSDVEKTYLLESSSDLVEWSPFESIFGDSVILNDPDSYLTSKRFYRVSSTIAPIIPQDPGWKNRITIDEESFAKAYNEIDDPNSPLTRTYSYVKFIILMDDLTRVYFQDSNLYPLHYDFAVEKIPQFTGMSRFEFNQRTLYYPEQEAILGAAIFYNDSETENWGLNIQFVGLENYPREFLRYLIKLVGNSIDNNSSNFYYLPTYELGEFAANERSYFRKHGIYISSSMDYLGTTEIFATGWTIGRVKYFPAYQVDAAYQNGELLPTDILITDGIPSELPRLAGIISSTPPTPNSHVVLLANSYRIPMAYIGDEDRFSEIKSLDGQELVFWATDQDSIVLVNANDNLDLDAINYLKSKKAPVSLNFDPKAVYGSISEITDALTPADTKFFGGKASNFGFLRRTIPDNTRPTAIALSFDLWDAYLAQEIEPGVTLEDAIEARLSSYTWPVNNLPGLRSDLSYIKTLFKDVADFNPQQRQDIFTALAVFETTEKLRFRSSTNLEDSQYFSGAGLYDSYSGCLEDDLDADDLGPSACDPDKDKERGAFRAIRKVYASFYNENAFLERLRFGIDESQVGMALLVHASYPDEIEMANGVITTEKPYSRVKMIIVSQPEATSVTNPTDSESPEIVESTNWFYNGEYHIQNNLNRRADLLRQTFETVLEWENEYDELAVLVHSLNNAFEDYYPDRNNFKLDLEYKKIQPGKLEIKQVREIPNDNFNNLDPVIYNRPPGEWRVSQGEGSNAFSRHRLKAAFRLVTDIRVLDETGLSTPFLQSISQKRFREGSLQSTQSTPADFTFKEDDFDFIYEWQEETEYGTATFQLSMPKSSILPQSSSQIRPLTSLPGFSLKVEYPQDLIFTNANCTVCPTNIDTALFNFYPVDYKLPYYNRLATITREAEGVRIESKMIVDSLPPGITAGFTPGLLAWEGTTITGLTTEPIYLESYYSQTYAANHHGFGLHLLYEPQLEEGISETILQELRDQNIRMILSSNSFKDSGIWLIGVDGSVRKLND